MLTGSHFVLLAPQSGSHSFSDLQPFIGIPEQLKQLLLQRFLYHFLQHLPELGLRYLRH